MKGHMKVGKIINFIFYTLAFIVLLVIMVTILSGAKEKNGITFGSYSLLTVLTGSMSPTFDAGSIIITEKVAADKLQTGDILTYSPHGDNTLVTHRIVEVIYDGNGYSYITRGDANNVDDALPVAYGNTVGRVIFCMNGIGLALLYIRTPKGIAYIITVMLLLIFLSSLLSRYKEYASEKKRADLSS